jgi:hypothetical protein
MLLTLSIPNAAWASFSLLQAKSSFLTSTIYGMQKLARSTSEPNCSWESRAATPKVVLPEPEYTSLEL